MNQVANGSIACYDLLDLPFWAIAWHATVISAIIAASLVGSALVTLMVIKYKQLRCRSVIVGLNLVAVDLLLTVCFHIPALGATAMRKWPFTDVGCKANGFLAIQFTYTRWLIMATIAIDRFCTVRFPLSYQRYSKWLLVVLTIMAWGCPPVFSLPPLFGLGSYMFRPNIPTCLAQCDLPSCKVFYAIVTSLHIIVGGLLPTLLYIWLYCKARKLRHATVTLGEHVVRVSTGVAVATRTLAPQLDRNSRELRAVITFVIIFIVFIVTGLPQYCVGIIRAANISKWCKIPHIAQLVVSEIFFLSTAVDPMLIMRDRDFRQCLKDMVDFRKCVRTRQRSLTNDTKLCNSNVANGILETQFCIPNSIDRKEVYSEAANSSTAREGNAEDTVSYSSV